MDLVQDQATWVVDLEETREALVVLKVVLVALKVASVVAIKLDLVETKEVSVVVKAVSEETKVALAVVLKEDLVRDRAIWVVDLEA